MSTALIVDAREAPEVLKKLNPKQHQFCREYMVDLNATQAAIRAGYSKRSAGTISDRLMQDVAIKARIAELALIKEKRANKSADDVIKELENVGFSRLGDIVEWNQSGMAFLKDSDSVLDDAMAAIESVQVTEEQSGDDKDQRMVLKTKVKLHSKMAALTQLAKHHGLVQDKIDVTVPIAVQVNVIDYSKVEIEEGEK